jgi:predicted transcriptional regulator
MKIIEVYKASKTKVHGCNEEFNTKTDAIIFLLKTEKYTNKQIAERLSVTPQQIYYASKKMKK